MQHFRRYVLRALVSLLLFLGPTDHRESVLASGAEGISTAAPAIDLQYIKGSTGEAKYRTAWQLIAANYLHRSRLASWNDWLHKYDGQLDGAEKIELALMQMVGSLADDYTYYRDAKATQSWLNDQMESNVVSSRRLGSVGYIRIKTFSSRLAADETLKALASLSDTSAIIIDLRGNRGGFIDEACRIYAMLADRGDIVNIRGWMDSHPYTERRWCTASALYCSVNHIVCRQDRAPPVAAQKRLAVLIDHDTRSAAELLAGALRDNKRALLIGSKTYGKGIIQKSFDLDSQTSIKIAVARYFLPGGSCPDRTGLEPDCNITGASSNEDVLQEAARQLGLTVSLGPVANADIPCARLRSK